MNSRVLASIALLVAFSSRAHGGPQVFEEKLAFESFDRFVLNTVIAWPKKMRESDVKKVVIILHGSGPQDMDGSFTRASADGKTRLGVYRDIAHALARAGHVAIRFHKRGYEWQVRLTKEPGLIKGPEFKKAMQSPLTDLVEDATALGKYARKRFPGAGVYYVGHSQGTFLALQVAHKHDFVKGVALIGSVAGASLETLSFEQIVYRPVLQFRQFDRDHDGQLTVEELSAAKDPMAAGLKMQLPYLDTDGDKRLSLDEFKAAMFTSFLQLTGPNQVLRTMLREEFSYPNVGRILARCKFKVGFFQGDWDNQTPAYQLRAIELLNRFHWKNQNLRFQFFPRLGHALDPRSSYDSKVYGFIDKRALAELVKAFDG